MPVSCSVMGLVNLFHVGAGCLSLLLMVLAVCLILLGVRFLGFALVAAAIGIVMVQLATRIRHIRAISHLRVRRGALEVLDNKTGAWLPVNAIERIRREDFPYADPWRPITLGYPGLSIALRGGSKPVEHLYPPGLEEQRDEAFRCLMRHYPELIENGNAGAISR